MSMLTSIRNALFAISCYQMNYSEGATFGFTSCSTSYNQWSATNDLMTLTYFEADAMYQCKIQGGGLGGTEYICDTDDSSTRQCASSGDDNQNGLQISIPYNPLQQEDDVCVDNLVINGATIEVDGNSNFVGDGDNNEMKNYRYFDFGDDASNLPSSVSGSIVDGLPRCVETVSFGFTSCSTSYNRWSSSTESITLTYYEGNNMYECQFEGEGGSGGTEYVCNSGERGTEQCQGGTDEISYGLQISLPVDTSRQIDDICIANLLINDNFIYVEGNANFIGDGDRDTVKNYRYFDLGTGSIYLPSQATGTIVYEIPECTYAVNISSARAVNNYFGVDWGFSMNNNGVKEIEIGSYIFWMVVVLLVLNAICLGIKCKSDKRRGYKVVKYDTESV